ncbi:MAG: coniferyl aldehyde dehydrogenase [Deltaproteobacteria bacterium]|nr:MAG: coniferyl aldehyde dehydrogenase [Deltaproteobacteria bacterium]
MTAASSVEPAASADAVVHEAFAALKTGWEEAGGLTYAQRMDALERILDATRRWEGRIADAIDADFGGRSRHETAMAEVFVVVSYVKYVQKHLKRWMKPSRRHVDMLFKPAANEVLYQPLGVVGVIAPWNYPFQLAMVPLASAIAAGNRVLLKPSEITAQTAVVLTDMMNELFSSRVVGVVNGGPDVGAAFSRLPFDHLFFTGSTGVGRHIMRAAAEHLTPVTLELGGKSPTIVHRDYPIEKAAERVAVGKCLNAGQTCIAPDYVLCPRDQVDAFVTAFGEAVRKAYPTLADNPDYTAVVNDAHYRRVAGYVDEARDAEVQVVEINPAAEALPPERKKLAPTLLLDPPDALRVMQDEIFGPVLPVVPYDHLDDAIRYVNARPRPLALYYFDRDRDRVKRVLRDTISGGVSVNETMLHIVQDDLPFGGVGPSGMGTYHGREGFETFSHRRAVFHQARLNTIGLLLPPYGARIDRLLDFMIGRKKS